MRHSPLPGGCSPCEHGNFPIYTADIQGACVNLKSRGQQAILSGHRPQKCSPHLTTIPNPATMQPGGAKRLRLRASSLANPGPKGLRKWHCANIMGTASASAPSKMTPEGSSAGWWRSHVHRHEAEQTPCSEDNQESL